MLKQKSQQETKEILQESGDPEKPKVVPGNTHIFKTYPEDLT